MGEERISKFTLFQQGTTEPDDLAVLFATPATPMVLMMPMTQWMTLGHPGEIEVRVGR